MANQNGFLVLGRDDDVTGSKIAIDLDRGIIHHILPVIGREELPEQEWPHAPRTGEQQLCDAVDTAVARVRGWFGG